MVEVEAGGRARARGGPHPSGSTHARVGRGVRRTACQWYGRLWILRFEGRVHISVPPAAARATAMATEAFCSFLGSWARQETEDAVAALRAASRAPNNLDPSIALLFDAVISHVQQPRSGEGVYMDNADAFELFVSSGGNVGMYDAIDVALSDAWYRSGCGGGSGSGNGWSLLDVGTGGGRGLLPALSRTASAADRYLPTVLEMVEPSMPMLSPALDDIKHLLQEYSSRRTAAATELRVHNLTLQELMARQDDQHSCWDVCQATFSLQSLPPLERRQGLAWLAKRCSRLLLVEFDVDQVCAFSPTPSLTPSLSLSFSPLYPAPVPVRIAIVTSIF